MELKPGVKLLGIRPELMMGLMVADAIFRSWSTIMVVTSIGPEVGVKRVPTSLHNVGQAADIRISNLPDGKVQQVVAEIAEAIGPEFDVVLEADKGHCHLEWQPKSEG